VNLFSFLANILDTSIRVPDYLDIIVSALFYLLEILKVDLNIFFRLSKGYNMILHIIIKNITKHDGSNIIYIYITITVI